VCLFIANIIAYYQLNGQFFLKEWYWHNPWTTSMIGYPVGMLFWYATKLSYEHFGFTWNMRMIGFGVGTINNENLYMYIVSRSNHFNSNN